MLDLNFQNLTTDVAFKKSFFVNVLNSVVRELELDSQKVEVSINLVGVGRIKQLNKKYRRKNKVTDVLSFPMDKKLEIENWKLKIPISNALTFDMGDIFICLPFAKKQAKSENVSVDKKLAQLTAHGFLHLMGYDHEKSTSEAKKMFDLEKLVLSKFKLD